MFRSLVLVPQLKPLLVVLAFAQALTIAVIGCGGKLFPDCNAPDAKCPPCTGTEEYPHPCAAAHRDAGAEAGAGK